jgi:hypothetical protein
MLSVRPYGHPGPTGTNLLRDGMQKSWWPDSAAPQELNDI